MWHRFLCWLKIRDHLEYSPPFYFEVNHPFEKDEKLNCCTHCGGGRLHRIHKEPYDPKRLNEIMTMRAEKAGWPQGGPHGELPAGVEVDFDEAWRQLQAERGTFPDPIYHPPVYKSDAAKAKGD
jgi:hypothetical protein